MIRAIRPTALIACAILWSWLVVRCPMSPLWALIVVTCICLWLRGKQRNANSRRRNSSVGLHEWARGLKTSDHGKGL